MLTTFLATVFVLGVLIFVHELGHFLAAKKIGIRVERFSLGFPPKLIGKKIGETEYCVSWIPLGGYVKMAGEHPDEKELTGAPWEFQSRKVWERMVVVFAGPAMNFLTAVLIFWGVLFLYGRESFTTTQIGAIQENSAAAKAGLQVGDRILSVGGSPTDEWDDIEECVANYRGVTLTIEVDRQGEGQTFSLSREQIEDTSDFTLGLFPFIGTEIGHVKKNMPAYQSGLKPGDKIVAINGHSVEQWYDMAEKIFAKPGIPIAVKWIRGDQTFDAVITSATQKRMTFEEIGRIGIEAEVDRKKVGILPSFIRGREMYKTTQIGAIQENSVAAKAGLQVGDRILSVAGSPVDEWADISNALEKQSGGTVTIEIDREGEEHTLSLSREEIEEFSDSGLGLSPFVGTEIGHVKKDMPAHQSGLEPGDKIIALDGHPVEQWSEMLDSIQAKPGIPITVTWMRGDQTFETRMTPLKERKVRWEEYGLIGIERRVDRKKVGILPSFTLGFSQTLYVAEQTLIFVKKLIFRQESMKLVGGPISIARMAGETARSGLIYLFGLMAFLSINLAILNILPIPILDGGHILFLTFEGITRKPLSLKQRGILQQIGLAFLILLMVYVTYNDIVRLFQ